MGGLVTERAPVENSTNETSILIVDDHRSFADLLAGALNIIPGLHCVGTAASAAEGIARAAELQPNIVVMDIEMPRQDGLQATRRIREVAPDTVIAVVTGHNDPTWISRAAQAGASAFIPKGGSLTEMIDILGRVCHGQMIVAPSTFDAGLSVPQQADRTPAPLLTPRELEVLAYLGKGMSVHSISQVLGISLNTCRGHVKSLHAKLGASSQLEAVIKAQNLGLIGTT
jgi:DNA-binding NarL/FixJ family response regulator